MLSWERARVADSRTRAVVSHFSAFRRVQGVVLLGRRGIRRSAVRGARFVVRVHITGPGRSRSLSSQTRASPQISYYLIKMIKHPGGLEPMNTENYTE